MPVQPAGAHAVQHPSAPSHPPAEARAARRPDPGGPGQEPGGGRPPDFGPGGEADFNHDGHISENESSVYRTRAYEREERYEARLDRSDEHEQRVEELKEAKIDAKTDREKARYDAYGDRVQAQAQMYSSTNNNKMHQVFGKTSSTPNLPPPPAPSA